jgi:hypothetical protein
MQEYRVNLEEIKNSETYKQAGPLFMKIRNKQNIQLQDR